MPELNALFPKKYVSNPDLNGNKVAVTIARIQIEEFDDHGRVVKKPVAYFVKGEKGFVINKTNATAIALIAGSTNTDHWPGTRILLAPAMVPFNGKMTESIRVEKPEKPEGAATPTAPVPPVPAAASPVAKDLDDEIPF